MHSGPKICFLTKNIYKSVNICPEIRKKNSQKTCFSWKQPIHSGLGIILSIPLDRAWNFWSVETLGQPFGTKLEVSVSNPPTENNLFYLMFGVKILIFWEKRINSGPICHKPGTSLLAKSIPKSCFYVQGKFQRNPSIGRGLKIFIFLPCEFEN